MPTITRQQTGVAGGYAGAPAAEPIPPCGIEDVDAAVLRAFNSDIGLCVTAADGVLPVRAIFAAGERWNQVKSRPQLRDKNGALILPLIAMTRTGITQDPTDDIAGRGINQQTGKLVVRRIVSGNDHSLQRLLNRVGARGLGLWRQPHRPPTPDRPEIGDLTRSDRNVAAGGVMVQDLTRSVIETVTIPAPQFVTLTYDIRVWTSYTVQMNEISERLIASYLPSDRAIKLVSPKGYWFIGYVEGDGLKPDGNADAVGDEERLIRAQLTLRVPAYIIATQRPGMPQPTRSTLSSPLVSFDVPEVEEPKFDYVEEPFLGADDPTLPRTVDRGNRRRDMRDDASGPTGTTWRRDPALRELRRGSRLPLYKRDRRASICKIDDRYFRSRSVNTAVGETAYDGFELAEFELAVG
jgi:hypothetical protein